MTVERLPNVWWSVLAAILICSPVAAQERLSENRLDPRFADTPMITDHFDFSLGGFLIDLNSHSVVRFDLAKRTTELLPM